MRQSEEKYDAIICVDTFVYFGDLEPAFRAASNTLKGPGLLVFTVESHSGEACASGYRLQHHGRYSHSAEYVEDLLVSAGFAVESIVSIVPRMEAGEPVDGKLVVASLAR